MSTAPNKDLEPSQNTSLASLSFIRKEMTETMEAVSKLADRSSSTTLLTIGGGLLLITFMLKVSAARLLGGLSTGEFISVLIVSTILLLAGSGIRLYQYNKEQEAGKVIRDSGVKLVTKGMEIGEDLAKDKSSGPT